MNNEFQNYLFSKEAFLEAKEDFLKFLESKDYNASTHWEHLNLPKSILNQALTDTKESMRKYYLEDLVFDENNDWKYLNHPKAIEMDDYAPTEIFLSRNRLSRHYDRATFFTYIVNENINFVEHGKDFPPLIAANPDGAKLLQSIIQMYPESCKLHDKEPFISEIDYSIFNCEIVRTIEINKISTMWYYLILKYIDNISYCGPFLEARRFLSQYKLYEILSEFEGTELGISELITFSKFGLDMYRGGIEILSAYVCFVEPECLIDDTFREEVGLVNHFYNKNYKNLADLMDDDLKNNDLFSRPYYYWKKKFDSFKPSQKRMHEKLSTVLEDTHTDMWKPPDIWEFFNDK